MTPEEHALWHQKQAAKTLEKNLRTIGEYIYDRSLWLIFNNRPRDRLVPYAERDIDSLRFTPEETDVMRKSLLRYQYNAAQIERMLPPDWKLPELHWKPPVGVSSAENISKKFNEAADYLHAQIKTMPLDPGWRGWVERVQRAFDR